LPPFSFFLISEFERELIHARMTEGRKRALRVMGAEGYPYGFNLTTEDGKPVVSFAYALESLPRLRQRIWSRLC
jgi:hypothetical protein